MDYFHGFKKINILFFALAGILAVAVLVILLSPIKTWIASLSETVTIWAVVPSQTPANQNNGGGGPENSGKIIPPAGPAAPINIPAPIVASNVLFLTKTLQTGSSENEVLLLQKYLNGHGFSLAADGPGSTGLETQNFGPLTRKAVVKFQEAHSFDILGADLRKGPGTVGPRTRSYINTHR